MTTKTLKCITFAMIALLSPTALFSQLTCGTTTSVFPYTEGFETNTGVWSNVTGDNFDWTRDSGGTPSVNTGPTTGSNGSTWYMYIETSSGATGNQAYFESDCFDFTGITAPIFEFDYHMYGATMGSLELFVTLDEITWTSVWNLSGDQGNAWSTASVDLSAYAGQSVKFRFVGTRGTSYTGDATIDNINIFNQVSMSFVSSAVSQASTATIETCSSNNEIIAVEVNMTGTLNPLDLTQLRIRTNGSTNPLADISNIDIYYTGTSSTFATTTLFGSAAPAATGVNIFVNGSQTLSSGTNYFWIVYDMSVGATIGNTLDGICNRITVDGSNYTPSPTNPGGNRTLVACVGAPGGISNGLDVWHKADAHAYSNAGTTLATDGVSVQQWNDNAPTGFDVSQATAANRPVFDEDAINYNPGLQFDGTDDHLFNTGFSLSGNTSHFIVAAPDGIQNDGLLNIASGTGSNWNNNAIYLTTRGPNNRLRFVFRNSPSSAGGNDLDAGNTLVFGQPTLMDFRRTQGALQETWVNCGDYQTLNATVSNYSGTSYAFAYGMLHPTARLLSGEYGEHIKYSRALSDTEKNKVDTYLAIKYGITMYDNYTATNDVQIYNVSTYPNQIIGIGRDDAEALIQRQSHAMDDSSRIYMSNLVNTNVANTGSFSTDISYVVMGNDQGMLCSTAGSAAEMPTGLTNCNLYSRLEREWKITKSNYAQNFNLDLAIEPCAVQGSVITSDLRLLVDDDGNFGNGGTQCYYNGDGTGIVISYAAPYITISNISNTHIANNITRYITIASIDPITPLPVTFLDMDIECEENKAVLHWATTSELNNDFFKIEKSRDMQEWKMVALVEGMVNNSGYNAYTYIDQDYSGSDNYYRLSQFDMNGDMTVLKTMSADCSGNQLLVYPNPFNTSITVKYPFSGDQEYQILITDNLGRVILEEIVNQETSVFMINTEKIQTKGLYNLSIISNEKIVVQSKLTKL